MNQIKNYLKTLCFFLFILSLPFSLEARIDYRAETQPPAVEKALTFSPQGTLKQKDNGFVYLDVDNAFIDQVVPLLDHEGRLQPLPTSELSMGAHISVFYEIEQVSPEEIGQKFSFEVQEIRSLTLSNRDKCKCLWMIAVHSPELESLRQKYGKSPKLKGHDYHITLGKQLPCKRIKHKYLSAA